MELYTPPTWADLSSSHCLAYKSTAKRSWFLWRTTPSRHFPLVLSSAAPHLGSDHLRAAVVARAKRSLRVAESPGTELCAKVTSDGVSTFFGSSKSETTHCSKRNVVRQDALPRAPVMGGRKRGRQSWREVWEKKM
ncbi:hypothetical protein RRG08_031705 [Elysia crispata]|uniref:Uncharacterized protein n=1 Tax=Elysia crispata TaxID=231223 RepID=A0AAE1DF19_9GAST|nr:hypothetical protein RRG08_031705 [Elysia crispata]